MDESPKAFAPEISPMSSKRWVGRLIVAVLVGMALWNFIVSLTVYVTLPALARILEAGPQSPLYLGKGDFNLPGLFAAVLELCLALIAAILVNSWAQSMPKPVRRRVAAAAASTPYSRAPIPSSSPSTETTELRAFAPPLVPAPQPPKVAPAPTPKATDASQPAPSKPKSVRYNSVGDPIEFDE